MTQEPRDSEHEGRRTREESALPGVTDLVTRLEAAAALADPHDLAPAHATQHAKQLIAVAAVCCEAFRRAGLHAVLVGGGAIEFHLPGAYTTPDIDLVVANRQWLQPRREDVGRVFSALGFVASGSRHWVRGALYVEVPHWDVTDPFDSIIVDGYHLAVIRPEVVLVGRLVEFDQTAHTGHGLQALLMLGLLAGTLQQELLTKLAEREQVVDTMAALRAMLPERGFPTVTDADLRAVRDRYRAVRYGRSRPSVGDGRPEQSPGLGMASDEAC